jgi:hypothetical protein
VGVLLCRRTKCSRFALQHIPHHVAPEVQRLAEGSRCSIRMLNTRRKLIGARVVVVKQIAELCRIGCHASAGLFLAVARNRKLVDIESNT